MFLRKLVLRLLIILNITPNFSLITIFARCIQVCTGLMCYLKTLKKSTTCYNKELKIKYFLIITKIQEL
jgi:hypothetical protein